MLQGKVMVYSLLLVLLRSNLSLVQSIVFDRLLLKLELCYLVTDSPACLLNFLFSSTFSAEPLLGSVSLLITSFRCDLLYHISLRKKEGKTMMS